MKKNTDDIMSVMKKLKGKIPTREEYDEFNHYFEKHIAPQNVMKKTVDFMPPEMLSKLIDKFKEARIYSEPVYSESERFFRELANTIGKKEGYNGDYLTCLSQDELEDYIDNKKLPSEDVLKQRFEASAILYENGEVKIVVGKDVDLIEQNLMNKENENEVKGVVAFNGKVQGVCRIVWDPLNPGEFNEGDVLVTGMTRPEFVPLMEKSSAIVTDVGGILCHAAIVSREMKKPCIIGTKIATKIFKSGDKLEVDAINGIVRKV